MEPIKIEWSEFGLHGECDMGGFSIVPAYIGSYLVFRPHAEWRPSAKNGTYKQVHTRIKGLALHEIQLYALEVLLDLKDEIENTDEDVDRFCEGWFPEGFVFTLTSGGKKCEE